MLRQRTRHRKVRYAMNPALSQRSSRQCSFSIDPFGGRVHDLGRWTKDVSSKLIAAKNNVEPSKSFPDEVGIASLNNLRRHSDSEDDGPLTVNVVLSSVQRKASLSPRSGHCDLA